jgi:hypothetical protein
MITPPMLMLSSFAAGWLVAATPTPVPEPQNAAQTAPPTQVEPSDAALERIQKKLMREPAIKLDKQPAESGRGTPVFRVQVDAPALTIEQILGPDFLRDRYRPSA